MKRTFTRVFLFLWLTLSTLAAYAQGDALLAARAAISNGSSRDLAQYFATTVELGFDGDKQSYSATQAEFVMKDFFAKNASSGFEYIHKGASPEGVPYAIGKYASKSGSYRVFVKMKSFNGAIKIDTIEFTKE
ncbi:DUF4783 domain-containing protein [Hymenobacter aerilatus]|uniref:DUF4783 domain-containing protein n=1 Tax=Hymenobacter aerilatus TaxID=2932251 RepID=A0A8T9SX00_9BACT|nr:DUF4783 domain-containing protein [Hymenobacter aerilatus]UOR04700.1 DUF4783 domain-containing protein [Hymenobacter aerilatus]